jgi:hypothetical protein
MYAQGNVIPDSFAPQYSIIIFLAVVVGGANSLPWAVIGAITFEAFTVFGPTVLKPLLGQTVTSALPLILAGPGLIVTLLQYPAGNAEWGYQVRDWFLRRVAARRGLLVPSLVADRRVTDDEAGRAISEAGARYSLGAAPDADEPVISCPVCAAVLPVSRAAGHDHLRAPATAAGTTGLGGGA